MRLRGALIGCGYISRRQLQAWQQIPEAEIVAVCDLSAARAQEKADEFGITAVYDDIHRLLEETALDFVDIATPPESHPELVARAAAKGIHVLCQKPLAASMSEARHITDTCSQAGIVFMINENGRRQAWFRRIKALLAENRLGRPFYARFEMRRRISLPKPNFGGQQYFQDMPRLMVFEMGIHFLDTARFLFGEAVSVYAQLRRISPYIAGEDMAVLTVDFGDLTCLIDTSWCSVPEPQTNVAWGPVRLEGTEGTIVLKENGTLILYQDDSRQAWPFPPETYFQSFVATQKHFVDCLITGRTPETNGRDNLKTMALVMAAYCSADENRVVKVEEI